ncbi:MAG: 23S rRNA (uracil(1939)-C(5))-methyltransferase RlmD [Elusimicrobiota bacterium]
MNNIKINDLLELEITAIAQGGEGIGRHDNMVVFVPYTAVGDKARIRITEEKKTFARGEIVEIIKESEDRVKIECKHYYNYLENGKPYCGGCNLMHLTKKAQCAVKEDLVRNAFLKIGGQDEFKWEGIIEADKMFGYRNKVQMPIAYDELEKVLAGFYMPKSHKVVSITNCLIQPEITQKIAKRFLEYAREYNIKPYNEKYDKGELRHLFMRVNKKNDVMLGVVSRQKLSEGIKGLTNILVKDFPEIKIVFHNYNPRKSNVIMGNETTHVYGLGGIMEEIGHMRYFISPASFFQVNSYQAEKLYKTVLEFCAFDGGERVLDLYCGSGGIGLYIAKYVAQVTGVEEIKQAVHNARDNAKLNDINNIKFFTGRVEAVLEEKGHTIKDLPWDVVLVNPPRTGVKPNVIDAIAGLKPFKLIYVSCNPVTLARDSGLLKEKGYKLKRARSIDMFPQTSNVETVAEFLR